MMTLDVGIRGIAASIGRTRDAEMIEMSQSEISLARRRTPKSLRMRSRRERRADAAGL